MIASKAAILVARPDIMEICTLNMNRLIKAISENCPKYTMHWYSRIVEELNNAPMTILEREYYRGQLDIIVNSFSAQAE